MSMLYPINSTSRRAVSLNGLWGFRTDPKSEGLVCGWQNGLPAPDSIPVPASFADFYTDDGSNGNQGFVTQGLIKRLESQPAPDAIYACGPVPMLRALKELVLPTNIPCMVSMEGSCFNSWQAGI